MSRLRLVIALVLAPALVFGAAPMSLVAAQSPIAATDGLASDGAPEFRESPCLWDLPRNLKEGEDIVCGVVSRPAVSR